MNVGAVTHGQIGPECVLEECCDEMTRRGRLVLTISRTDSHTHSLTHSLAVLSPGD
jgi:hypothetical protein